MCGWPSTAGRLVFVLVSEYAESTLTVCRIGDRVLDVERSTTYFYHLRHVLIDFTREREREREREVRDRRGNNSKLGEESTEAWTWRPREMDDGKMGNWEKKRVTTTKYNLGAKNDKTRDREARVGTYVVLWNGWLGRGESGESLEQTW